MRYVNLFLVCVYSSSQISPSYGMGIMGKWAAICSFFLTLKSWYHLLLRCKWELIAFI